MLVREKRWHETVTRLLWALRSWPWDCIEKRMNGVSAARNMCPIISFF